MKQRTLKLASSRLAQWFSLLLLAWIVMMFQNCDSGIVIANNRDGSFFSVSPDLSGGNGDPYGGKLLATFYLIKEAFSCERDGGVIEPSVREKIELTESGLFLTQDMCGNTEPVRIDSSSVKISDFYAQFDGRLFQMSDVEASLFIQQIVQPNSWWVEQTCDSSRDELQSQAGRYHRFIIKSNWQGEKSVDWIESTISPYAALDPRTYSVSFQDFGHIQRWQSEEISVSIDSQGLLGEAMVMTETGPMQMALSCSLK